MRLRLWHQMNSMPPNTDTSEKVPKTDLRNAFPNIQQSMYCFFCGWLPLIREWFWLKRMQWELSLNTQHLAAVGIVTGNVVPVN